MQLLILQTIRIMCCFIILYLVPAVGSGSQAFAQTMSISPSFERVFARELWVLTFNISGGIPPYTTTSNNVDRAFNDDGGTTGIAGNGIRDGDEGTTWTGSPIQVTVPVTAAPGGVRLIVDDSVFTQDGDTSATIRISNAKGKISRNFYRVPYADDQVALVNQDYVDHGSTPAGNRGPMDMIGKTTGSPYVIVAAADGVVLAPVVDTNNDCGCTGAYGACNNRIRIRHENGEISAYFHIAQGSAAGYGIVPGVSVSAGDPIGEEGDVGFTCSPGGRPATGSCGGNAIPGAGNCGQHLHWEVRRESTNEFVNPMTCEITGHIYVDNSDYYGKPCDQNCQGNSSLTNETYDGFGIFKVIQNTDSITANKVVVKNRASLVLHAGRSVRLLPGFKAGAGKSYFRAEIGPCDTTAPNPQR